MRAKKKKKDLLTYSEKKTPFWSLDDQRVMQRPVFHERLKFILKNMSIRYAKKKKKSIVGTFKMILKTCEFFTLTKE